jgi:hypothetical protein
VLVSGDPLTDITATRAIEQIWRAGVLCNRRPFAASAAETAEVDAFYAQVAKAVGAVRERGLASTRPRPANTSGSAPAGGPPR